MDPLRNKRTIWISTTAMLLLTAFAYMADSTGNLATIRLSMLNMLSPGRFLLASISAPATRPEQPAENPSSEDMAALQDALLDNELQRRQLVIDNARLRNELRVARVQSNAQIVTGRSLVNFMVSRAGVLSRSGTPTHLTELFIAAGTDSGLSRSQLVVEGTGIVLDQGADSGIRPDQSVIAGLAVVGRVATTSRWVSLVQPLTDQDFSAAVQLVANSTNGATFGARGLLEGTGDALCRVTGVAYTAAVAVGDEVYSAHINGIAGPRLYYGTVVRADFSAGGEWDIHVQPAVDIDHLDDVAVVQPGLNSHRIRHPQSASPPAGASR